MKLCETTIFFAVDSSQNMFVYQTTLNAFELNGNKNLDYVISWKSKGYIVLNLSRDILISCIA